MLAYAVTRSTRSPTRPRGRRTSSACATWTRGRSGVLLGTRKQLAPVWAAYGIAPINATPEEAIAAAKANGRVPPCRRPGPAAQAPPVRGARPGCPRSGGRRVPRPDRLQLPRPLPARGRARLRALRVPDADRQARPPAGRHPVRAARPGLARGRHGGARRASESVEQWACRYWSTALSGVGRAVPDRSRTPAAAAGPDFTRGCRTGTGAGSGCTCSGSVARGRRRSAKPASTPAPTTATTASPSSSSERSPSVGSVSAATWFGAGSYSSGGVPWASAGAGNANAMTSRTTRIVRRS